MKHIRVVLSNWLGPRFALKRRNLLPEVVEHRVRRRVTIVSTPMHFSAGDHVDPGDFLFEDGSLARAKLGVQEVAFGKLTECYKSVQRLVPSWYAISADHSRRVLRVPRHAPSP